MVVVNTAVSEINAKIVYYGPALSGKTTNLEQIYERMPSHAKGKMVSMKTRTDRTLFFDFLPLELGDMGGYKTRMLLYTVPGQVYYNATRKLVLKGADAVVFVADSSPAKMEENIESLRNLEENLNELGLTLDTTPWVIQYNKRDLGDAVPIGKLESELNLLRVPSFEAVATQGVGIYETFQGIAGILYTRLAARFSPREKALAARRETSAPQKPAPPHESDETVSQVIDAALREVNSPERTALPPRAPSPQRDRRPAAVEAPITPRRPAAAPQRSGWAQRDDDADRLREREDDTLRFESLEVAPIDDAVGRVVDLGRDASQESEQTDSNSSVGLFLTDPFGGSAEQTEKEPKAASAPRMGSRAEEPPFRQAPPSAGDECVITVPVLISRSQIRKTIPIKLRLEVQVVDEDV
jgi:signal recognition particle receptor subunit beta